MSAGVESNGNIVDNDGCLSTRTTSEVGRYASKTGLVPPILCLLNWKVFLEEFGLRVLFITTGEVFRVNLDRAAESRCATVSVYAMRAPCLVGA
jgi:hypothetical protein